MIVDNDYSRELYTKTFTGSDWTDARNYDISLDVRKFGVNGAVDFLLRAIEGWATGHVDSCRLLHGAS